MNCVDRHQTDDATLNALVAPLAGETEAAGTWVASRSQNRSYGPKTAPTDLLAFVRAGSVRDASRALGFSLGTTHRLREGYWPDDPRRLLRAWAAYKGGVGRVVSSWFLRRVAVGGCIRHAGLSWSGVGLALRVGELVAVARTPDGLLAQTLELPSQRIPLEVRP